MRAAVVRDFHDDLSIETVDDPQCPATGVVLEVAACGVCRSDYHGWTGEHPRVTNGSILGHEYCGTVVEAGPQAKHKVGDKLIAPFILACGDCPACHTGVSNTCENAIVPGFGAPGAYAQFVASPFDHNLVHLPESMSPALAAGLGCRVKQLAVFGTRGMPSWKYPSLLGMIERGEVDLSPMVAREVPLSEASAELRAMSGPTAPGTAVITDFMG